MWTVRPVIWYDYWQRVYVLYFLGLFQLPEKKAHTLRNGISFLSVSS